MSFDQVKNILIICAVGPEVARKAISQIKSQYGKAEISVVISSQVAEDYFAIGSINYLHNLAPSEGNLVRRVIAVLTKLRRASFDLLIILCSDASRIRYLSDAILFSLLIPSQERIILDPNMTSRNLGMRAQITSVLDNATLLLGLPVAKMLTAMIFGMVSIFSNQSQTVRNTSKSGKNRVAVILPLIPDVSHTFIYREVVTMRRQGAQFDLVALEKGDQRIIHPEVATLLPKVIFLPAISQGQYIILYLYFLIKHPLRMQRLISFYMAVEPCDMFLFLDLSSLRNPLHPCRGLIMARELERLGTSYMHVYGSTYPATRALVASYLLDIPFSLSTFVDFDYQYDYKNFREKTQLARFVVACTRFCANRIRHYTSEEMSKKVHVIYFGINRDYASSAPRGTLDAKEKAGVIIAIAKLVEKKGFEYLVRACSILKARKIDVECVIVGEGPEKEKLLSLIKVLGVSNEVKLLGSIQDEQVKLYLRPENILVMPSVYAKDGERDGIPNVMLEAMICGLPVISTTVSGIPELIVDGENGLLVPERDEHALADAIEKLLRDRDLGQRLGRNGRERVSQHFDVEISASQVWSLIQAELDSPSKLPRDEK